MSAHRIIHIAYEVNFLDSHGDTKDRKLFHRRTDAHRVARASGNPAAVEKHTTSVTYREDYRNKPTTENTTTIIYREICRTRRGLATCTIFREDAYLTVETFGDKRILRAGGWLV